MEVVIAAMGSELSSSHRLRDVFFVAESERLAPKQKEAEECNSELRLSRCHSATGKSTSAYCKSVVKEGNTRSCHVNLLSSWRGRWRTLVLQNVMREFAGRIAQPRPGKAQQEGL